MNEHTQAVLDEMDITLTCDRLMAPHKGQILAYLEQILTAQEGESEDAIEHYQISGSPAYMTEDEANEIFPLPTPPKEGE